VKLLTKRIVSAPFYRQFHDWARLTRDRLIREPGDRWQALNFKI
jgi:hypothetical protein